MKKTLLIISILFAAACGGKSDSETMDPCQDPCKDGKRAAHDCESMADQVSKAMSSAPDMTEDAVAQARGIMADQCTSAAWSQELIDCMAMATGPEEGEQCVEMMSEEQKTSFVESMDGMNGGGDEGMDGGGDEGGME